MEKNKRPQCLYPDPLQCSHAKKRDKNFYVCYGTHIPRSYRKTKVKNTEKQNP